MRNPVRELIDLGYAGIPTNWHGCCGTLMYYINRYKDIGDAISVFHNSYRANINNKFSKTAMVFIDNTAPLYRYVFDIFKICDPVVLKFNSIDLLLFSTKKMDVKTTSEMVDNLKKLVGKKTLDHIIGNAFNKITNNITGFKFENKSMWLFENHQAIYNFVNSVPTPYLLATTIYNDKDGYEYSSINKSIKSSGFTIMEPLSINGWSSSPISIVHGKKEDLLATLKEKIKSKEGSK